jgi:hypothetical protein
MRRLEQFPSTVMLTLLLWLLSSQPSEAFYNPSTGRWLTRDPVEEKGGPNLQVFCRNSPSTSIDMLGLRCTMLDPRTQPPRARDPGSGNCILPHMECDGKGGIRINFGTCPIKCFQQCVEQHENSHIADAKRSCPYICRSGCYNGDIRPGRLFAFNDDAERKRSECKAWTTELNCLLASREGATEECKGEIEKEIDRARQNIRENCR